MGRSRAAHHSADEDPAQSRSKRKRTAQNMENTDTVTTVLGMKDGKKALYHCNYCNKDISGKIRIKCVMCSDFDLCVECFSVGAEVHPHESNHPYRVMDNLLFPLICPEWNADEEILLLEGIEMYGLGNWAEVAEHVGTKSKARCIEHYNTIYMNSPSFPLPDMSHVIGKSREELLAMAKEHAEISKGTPTCGEENGAKTESPSTAGTKLENQRKEVGSGEGSSYANTSTGVLKGVSSIVTSKDGHENIKVEDRSIGEKKPRIFGEKGPSVKELSGYNSKRQEFEVEYDNDAEQLLADMEFKDTDSNGDRELKLRVLHIYSKRLDERKRRKDFILERNLLYPDPFEEDLTMEEKDLCHHYRVFMRFHSREEHEQFLRSIIEEHRILKRIQDLQEARAAGCCTSVEAERYIEQKIKRETDENAHRVEGFQAVSCGKASQRVSPSRGIRSPGVHDSEGKYLSPTTKGIALSNFSENWDVTGFLGADLLSDSEKKLCGEIRILPTHYLNMLQTMSMGILNGNITNKSDAHGLFNVDASKVDKVYDMLMEKGILQT